MNCILQRSGQWNNPGPFWIAKIKSVVILHHIFIFLTFFFTSNFVPNVWILLSHLLINDVKNFFQKSIADVRLVGMPNAAKSTQLGALSKAQQIIGHYTFTNLRPNLGNLTPNIRTYLILRRVTNIFRLIWLHFLAKKRSCREYLMRQQHTAAFLPALHH